VKNEAVGDFVATYCVIKLGGWSENIEQAMAQAVYDKLVHFSRDFSTFGLEMTSGWILMINKR
jgi:hypothetical protein